MKYLKTFENFITNKKIVLYHGSDSEEVYKQLNDNTWFSINDYIASSYADNMGGFVYKCNCNINSFLISEDRNRQIKKNIAGTDIFWIDFFLNNYNKKASEIYQRYGFTIGLGNIVEGNAEPIINYVKNLNNNYNSIEFLDISFDNQIVDTCYIVFNGKDVKIKNIYKAINTEYSYKLKKINENLNNDEIILNKIDNLYNNLITKIKNTFKNYIVINSNNITYLNGDVGSCELNSFNLAKSNNRYKIVLGYLIDRYTPIQHWWIYDSLTNKYIDPTKLDNGYYVYIGIIINDDLSNIKNWWDVKSYQNNSIFHI